MVLGNFLPLPHLSKSELLEARVAFLGYIILYLLSISRFLGGTGSVTNSTDSTSDNVFIFSKTQTVVMEMVNSVAEGISSIRNVLTRDSELFFTANS